MKGKNKAGAGEVEILKKAPGGGATAAGENSAPSKSSSGGEEGEGSRKGISTTNNAPLCYTRSSFLSGLSLEYSHVYLCRYTTVFILTLPPIRIASSMDYDFPGSSYWH